MNDDWQYRNDQPKTRADYRREQEQAEKDFQERDRKRVQVEKEYARKHGQPKGNEPTDEPPIDQRVNPADVKQKRLGHRLNWAIFWLSAMIIIVYLILFLFH
ncbi:hypothetical protein [Levilactobacillus tujiorum]|uniref:Uncharacterized protein n=1 Tax=Levilactobacillus tujiorum TaxID=2912243 RepID=A0ABX1L3G5_9LACO|nr:hypothetical protein [Levilactobacillus tujiorum]MCH5463877.1 hypothetical protein [Levilactobacillus tujiorum]NLR12392.1 hypothetical protein [Lactobacillus sp. HBUAS51387]NLR28864.1 hypothetical protein [Levilactobacillus tujiorum]